MQSCTGKVFVTGSGTSGATARRMAHLLAVCGTPSTFIHPMDALHGTMGALAAGDVLISISRGGESAEINDFSTRAQRRSVSVVALTAEPESTLGRLADVTVTLITEGEGDPGGVIAMGSTLVTSVWGDALANILMRRRGYGWDQVLETHPAGAVGQITDLPDPLTGIDAPASA
nr:SIS domain-containing protein [Microbacterium aquimaris]